MTTHLVAQLAGRILVIANAVGSNRKQDGGRLTRSIPYIRLQAMYRQNSNVYCQHPNGYVSSKIQWQHIFPSSLNSLEVLS